MPAPYNLQNFGIDKAGNKVPLIQTSLGVNYDPGHSHTAFLNMCDLDPATNTEGALNFADVRATTNLTGFFKWGQPPRAFQVIPAPLGADFFLHDKRPMEPPDDD